MQYFKIAVLLFILCLSIGCGGTDGHSKGTPTLKVRLLWQGVQCGTNRLNPYATWIDSPDQFEKTFARLTKNHIGAQTDLSSRVDFSLEGLLVIAMGRKPTGGYGLQLKQEYAVIKDDTAVLKVSWIKPSKGAIVPQVITSPCLAIILPKGPYSQIHLLDQDAHLRLQLPVE